MLMQVPVYEVVDSRNPQDSEYSAATMATMNRDSVYTDATATNNHTSSEGKGTAKGVGKNKKYCCLVAVLASVVILTLIFTGCFIAVFMDLKSNEQTLPPTEQISAVMGHLQQIDASLSSIEERLGKLEATVNTQRSKIQQLNISLEECEGVDTVQNREVQQLNASINTISDQVKAFHPVITSCAALPPSSPSGYYWVVASNGSAVQVYCDMTRLCGEGGTGGWRRVAELDMTNRSHLCPPGLELHTDSNKRTCVRNSNSGGCSSVTIPTATVEYSRVCGKIKAYQVGSPDAFNSGSDLIDFYYVDGISLTHGRNPRKHIWTFAAGRDEVSSIPASNCPCTSTNTANMATQPPAFVGNDYFCDTSSSGTVQIMFYPDDPLWDGTGCGPLNTCCSFNNPPWFSKQLPQPTSDDIELRVCSNSGLYDSAAIETVEIYVQ